MKSLESEMTALWPEFTVTVKPQFSHAKMRLFRSRMSYKLHAYIESYAPGNPDPVRVDAGPLNGLIGSLLRRRHPDIVDQLLAELNAAGADTPFLNEVLADLDPDAYLVDEVPYD